MTGRLLLRAYADETGDRGTSATASRFFAMAGVVVADEDDHLLRQAITTCRTRLRVPAGKALHWRDHVKVFPRRQFVTGCLANLPMIVNYVVFEKAAIPATAHMYSNQEAFYNYAAGILLERLLLTARDWPGGPRDIAIKLGHVRGFDHATTAAYFARKATHDSWLPWHLKTGRVQFVTPGSYDGMQAADQYAGMLNAALCPNQYGGFEAPHLLAVRHQIRRVGGRAWGIGFKVMAQPGTMETYPWWPPEGI